MQFSCTPVHSGGEIAHCQASMLACVMLKDAPTLIRPSLPQTVKLHALPLDFVPITTDVGLS